MKILYHFKITHDRVYIRGSPLETWVKENMKIIFIPIRPSRRNEDEDASEETEES